MGMCKRNIKTNIWTSDLLFLCICGVFNLSLHLDYSYTKCIEIRNITNINHPLTKSHSATLFTYPETHCIKLDGELSTNGSRWRAFVTWFRLPQNIHTSMINHIHFSTYYTLFPQITIADLYFYCTCATVAQFATNFLATSPKLAALHSRVEVHPKVAEWLKIRPGTSYKP